MRKAVLIVLLAAKFGLSEAKALDVFFNNDSKSFVKTELITVQGFPSLKYSGCEVNSSGSKAICTDVAIIHLEEFSKMRLCERSKMAINGVAAAGGVAFGVLIGSGLGPVAGVVAGGSLAGGSLYLVKEASFKEDIYDDLVERDQDHVLFKNYEDFITSLAETLRENLIECDVSGATEEVSVTPYEITLNKEQQKNLWKAKYSQ